MEDETHKAKEANEEMEEDLENEQLVTYPVSDAENDGTVEGAQDELEEIGFGTPAQDGSQTFDRPRSPRKRRLGDEFDLSGPV